MHPQTQVDAALPPILSAKTQRIFLCPGPYISRLSGELSVEIRSIWACVHIDCENNPQDPSIELLKSVEIKAVG
jgi:hypothetical protein